MKLKTPHFLLLICSSLFFTGSCKKDSKCEAGTGGSLTIVAKLKHHGVVIPNDSLYPDTVWVKFSVKDWANPPSGYDLRFIGSPGEDHVHLPGLKCGDYFFYAAGYDTSISQNVMGGTPFSTSLTNGELDIDLAVVE